MRGLEAALFDHEKRELRALDPSDGRVMEVLVAGPAALLVAKLHKVWERRSSPSRTSFKDGLDILRLLQGCPAVDLATTLHNLVRLEPARSVTVEARGMLDQLFGRRESVGTQMAVRASVGLENAETIAASCVALTRRLLDEWRQVLDAET